MVCEDLIIKKINHASIKFIDYTQSSHCSQDAPSFRVLSISWNGIELNIIWKLTWKRRKFANISKDLHALFWFWTWAPSEKQKRLSPNMFDNFATHTGLVYDVTDTDSSQCLCPVFTDSSQALCPVFTDSSQAVCPVFTDSSQAVCPVLNENGFCLMPLPRVPEK